MVDLTRLHKFAQKKTLSISAARLLHSDVAATTLQELFNLPENALITEAGIVVHTAGQAGLTVDFGFEGGNELGNDIALDATGYFQVTEVATLTTLTGTITALTLTEGAPNTLDSGTVALTSGAGTVVKSPRILTATGKNVTAKFSADPSAGDFSFIVQYIEFQLCNGEKTNYTA